MDEMKLFWIWLAGIKGIGPHIQHDLCQHFQTPREIYEADKDALTKVRGLGIEKIQMLIENKSMSQAWQILKKCQEQRIRIMTLQDKIFPQAVRNYMDFPVLLYYKGIPQLDKKSIGIIGSRRCSSEGKQKAIALATDMAFQNIPVISGMAKGIDSYAHTAVLKNGGYTVAVLGNGLDQCYPKEHQNLMENIIQQGMVLSEYPPGTPPYRYNFPRRNRIIAALSEEFHVIESGSRSGTRTTVEYCEKYGHRVFWV